MDTKTTGKQGRPTNGRVRRHVYLDPDINKKLDEISEDEERGFSNQVNLALRAWLKSRK